MDALKELKMQKRLSAGPLKSHEIYSVDLKKPKLLTVIPEEGYFDIQ